MGLEFWTETSVFGPRTPETTPVFSGDRFRSTSPGGSGQLCGVPTDLQMKICMENPHHSPCPGNLQAVLSLALFTL